ncbi:MAG: hypothetical protein JXQ75_09165 [Phycisphaerae bacterium]|nr:hypothetical protein [Phycisphaerae bacterium]
MNKRYVFWRTPAGKPYKCDDDKCAPTILLDRIGTSASLTDKGEIRWPYSPFHNYHSAVVSAVVIQDAQCRALNDSDTRSIIRGAIISVIKKQGGGKPIAPSAVIESAQKLVALHFREPIVQYVLLGSLSVSNLPATRLHIRDCEIAPLKKRVARFPYPDALLLQARRTPLAQHIKSTQYQMVKVKTAGRSFAEATDSALAALNLLRGLWTLLATYGSSSMTFGIRKQQSIGVIHTGPIYTLHHPDGTLVGDVYWYEHDYTGDQKLFDPKAGWETIEKNRKWAVRRIRRLPYRNDIEELIIRYVTALDHSNLDVAFLQMWSILEKLTDTVGAKYDETIRRATWLDEDRHLARQLLESLRLRRNRFVHAARSSGDREETAYMMKSFVEPHLLRLICNHLDVQSLEEYSEYLRLPSDAKTLEKRQRMLRRAIRMSKM